MPAIPSSIMTVVAIIAMVLTGAPTGAPTEVMTGVVAGAARLCLAPLTIISIVGPVPFWGEIMGPLVFPELFGCSIAKA
jgi:hypothetical protein